MIAAKNPRLLLMLDYDGTLVPIAPTPARARLSAARRRRLAALARTPGVQVAVVTGRSLGDIRKLAGVPGAVLAANHGFEIRCGGRTFFPRGCGMRRPIARLAREFEAALRSIPGILVEPKGFSVAVHYRLAPRMQWREVERTVRRASLPYRRRFGWKVTGGKRVWEVRPARHWNKGDAALWIWKRFAPRAVPIYIGDDATDEDAFRALKDKGITIAVGRRRGTAAAYGVKDVRDVWRIIRMLATHEVRRRKKGGR